MLFHRLVLSCCFAATLALVAQSEAAQARVLYSFKGSADGDRPDDLLRDSAGNFYGTTIQGGDTNCNVPNGCGVVFKLSPEGTETVLHTFSGDDGADPAGLRRDEKTGDLYGVAVDGGSACGCGLIYKLTADGKETVLHEFSGGDGGSDPIGLRRDSAGNIFGIAAAGGASNCGLVYELTADGAFKTLHAFSLKDGCGPSGYLIGDGGGNFYGTTLNGGVKCGDFGCGVLFKIGQDGSYEVLHAFKGGKDGTVPTSLVRDESGNIYGTTIYGGGFRNCGFSCGVLYKLSASGSFTVLHAFAGGSDGGFPGGLQRRNSGKFYGVTTVGGEAGCGTYGCGTVFSVARDGTVTTVYRFPGGSGGNDPGHLALENDDRHLYGVTSFGGRHDSGTVFELK